MIPCCEILFNTPIVKKLIREDRYEDLDDVLRNGEDDMQSFDNHLLALVRSGGVELEEALLYVRDEGAFRRALKGKYAGGDRGRLISGA